MAILRKLLWLMFSVVLSLLYIAWWKDYAKTSSVASIESKQITSEPIRVKVNPPVAASESHKVQFKTDVVAGVIDLRGGHLVQLELLQYACSKDEKLSKPVSLLDHSHEHYHVAQTDLIPANHTPQSHPFSLYQSDQASYTLTPDDNELLINLYRQEKGITVKKQFILTRGNYQIGVKYHVHNQSETPWIGKLYAQLQQQSKAGSSQWFSSISAYVGGAISTERKPYEKIKLNKMDKVTLPQGVQQGWISWVEPYFASAWISKMPNMAYYSQQQEDHYTLGMISPEWTVIPKQESHYEVALYAGPKIAERLEAAAKHLGLIVDYGMFWFIANGLVWLLNQCYRLIGNWGWAIVSMTLLLKLAFYRWSARSIRPMTALQRLQPKLDALKARYGDDREKFAQEQLALYRREGVSPLSGLLTGLMQLPISMALYCVLLENVALRHQPFLGWVQDLSAKDPYYILPVLTGLTMWVEQNLGPTPPKDSTQANMALLGPVVFAFMFLNMPSGLVVYWVVNSFFSSLQKWWILGRPNMISQLTSIQK